MDGRGNRLEDFRGPGDYIWLRYGTQLTVNGRSYTIEMNVPMPVGASEERREQLLREADAGMNQVAGHVENRVAHLLNVCNHHRERYQRQHQLPGLHHKPDLPRCQRRRRGRSRCNPDQHVRTLLSPLLPRNQR